MMEFDTYRNLVVVSVNGVLSDVSKLSDSTKHSHLSAGLDFITDATHQFPELFVPPASACVRGPQAFVKLENSSTDSCCRESKDVLHDSQPYSLTCWVTSHLLRILAIPNGGIVHDKTCEVLLRILRTTSTHNPYAFRRLATEFIVLLANLCKISDKFFKGESSEKVFHIDQFSSPLESLPSDASELALTRRPLEIGNIESCQQLQTSVTKILQDLHMELQLSAFDRINFVDNSDDCCILWSVVACQLEFGDVPLKTASLRLASKLLMHSIPPAAALDYFISCLSALVNLLCSGFSGCERDIVELEEALAGTVAQILDLLQGDSLQHRVSLLYDYAYEVLTSNGIMLCIAKHGTSRLHTASLCGALCRSMANVVRHIGYQADIHLDVIQRLVSEIGVHSASYGFFSVVMIHEVVHYELLGCAVPSSFYSQSVAGHPSAMKSLNGVSESVSEGDANCQPSSGDAHVMVSDKSTVAALLYHRCVSMLENLRANKADNLALLGGIRVVTEVLARCAISYHQLLHSQGSQSATLVQFFDVIVMNQMLGAWFEYLNHMCTADTLDVCSLVAGYRAIICAAGSLMFVCSLGKTLSDIIPQLLEVLSLPWLVSETSWLDFKTTQNVRQLAAISKVISDNVDAEMIADILKLLCVIPRSVSPQWRTHIMCQCASDSRDVVRVAAVSNLPTLLHTLGPSSHHLLKDILLAVLPYSSMAVKETVADVVGRITCVISATSTLTRSSLPETCHTVSQALQLDCSFCSLSAESKKTVSVTSCESANMLIPLITALSTADGRNIKIRFVRSFSQLFGHAWYWQNTGMVTDLVNLVLAMQQDVDSEVRMSFYSNIKYLVPPPSAKVSPRMNALPIKKMAVESRAPVNELVLSSIGEIATLAENDLLNCIIALLNEILFPTSPLLEAVARQQMKQIANSRHTSLPQLYMKFGKEMSNSIVDCLHKTMSAKPSLDLSEVLQKIADVFSFEDVQSYLKRTEHLLIPRIVRKASSTATLLMQTISRLVDDPNHKNVIVRTIGHVFCHVVCSCDGPEEFQKVFSYIENEMELTLTRLLLSGNHIESLLLMQLSVHHGQVLNGLKIWLQAKGSFEGMDISLVTNEQLSALLQPDLLGILVYFDKHLKDGTVPIEDKRQTFKSLIQLMRLMGSQHITSVRMHIMTTLRIGLQFQDLQFTELCCEAWNCFVRLLDASVLGQMLSQIVANLLPLLKTELALSSEVAEIFEFLIVDNQELLKQHLHELYFLPDICELQHVNSVLRPYVDAVYGSGDLQVQIEYLIKGVSHELLDIRQIALSKLTHCLQTNKDVLHSLILSSETAQPVVSQMVTVLLSGCREPDATTRGLIGRCLGEIGAVDPGRLELTANQPKEELPKFISCMADDGFAFDLINELAKAFLGADDRTAQDCVAYALQELIRIYNVCTEQNEPGNSRSINNGSGQLWQRFSVDVQEILIPLSRSRYKLNFVVNHTSTLIHPIYRSHKGANFESWVCTLTNFLGTKLEHDVSRRVFEACCGVVKQGGDSHISVHVLPHVAVQVILDGNEEARSKLLQEILAVLNDIKEPDSHTSQLTDLRHMSAQTVFSVLDHLTRWLRHRQTVLSLQSPSTSSTTSSGKVTRASNNSASDCNVSVVDSDKDYCSVKTFLDCIPQDVLAVASYNCGAYMRAFMHHELHFRSYTASGMPRNAPETLDFLLKLYVAVDEPDGVAGIIAVQNVPLSLEQQILAFESVGRLSDASMCYEHAIRSQPDNVVFRRGLLCNQLALGELNSAVNLASGMISDNPSWSSELNACRIESAWRLGQWDKLQQYVSTETTTVTWNTGLGKLLLAAKVKDEATFCSQMDVLRLEEMAPLSAASMEAGCYQRGYEHIVRLHMLNELEEGLRCLLNFEPAYRKACFVNPTTGGSEMDLSTLSRRWNARLQCCQLSHRYQDAILNLRRVILQLARAERGLSVNTEVGQCWLQSARVARECGLLQTAQSSLLSAADFRLPEFHLEKAQWLWDRGDFDRAQSCLEKAAEEIFPDRDSRFRKVPVSATSTEEQRAARLTCARMLLQLGRYCDETASCESNAVMRQLMEATQVHGEWEDGFFYLATYWDKVMMAVVDRPEKRGDCITRVVEYFGYSLQYGSQFIYQSMPRMLTLWLDYGAEVVTAESAGEKSSTSDTLRQGMRLALDKLNRQMSDISKKLAPYQFLIALPQLVSRICHAHSEVFAQLRSILAALLCEFPQQCVWTMMAVSKSSYTVRVRRCQEIFAHGRTRKPELAQFLTDMTRLVDRLLELCNRTVEGGSATTTLSVAQHFKPLQRLVEDASRSAILLPLQSQMTPTLPAMPVPPASHVPFAAASAVFLVGIEDTVDVLASLQRPKKVTLRGSDGRRYAMLCKPKDDLRKDARLMEFNGIVNRCLLRDAESRRRALHIRTFSVTALNEECGLLEWVPNTNGLRPILLKLYRKLGLYMSGKELKMLQLAPNAPLDKKLAIYRTKLLPRHPPVFGDWFLQTFPDPTSWYNARLAYCRTAAVMSMVGYVLGLGDRHGENILLDSTTGDCVHVDFNCLFNKGETFDYPEIVPFRLTHNMVEAMGPLGAEGIFRRSCEVTLRVMRDQTDPLMSVLRTFIYDPLVEWSKSSKGRSTAAVESGEIRNEKAQTHVNNIEDRLRGILKSKTKPRGLPLSVDGHVSHLIKEATDEKNLCQMYIGWAAYM